MPKNISPSRKKGVAAPELPLNLLDAVRQVGDEAVQNVYNLALEREKLCRKAVEPTSLAKRTFREVMQSAWNHWPIFNQIATLR